MDFDRTVSHLAKNKNSSICSQNVNISFRETHSIPGTKQVGSNSVKNLGLKHDIKKKIASSLSVLVEDPM